MKEPKDINEYLDECTKIEPAVLEEEFVRVPSDLAFWNNKYAGMYRLWLECKAQRETLYAQLYGEKRTELEAFSAKGRATEAAIDASIMLDDRYTKARAAEIASESEKVRLGGVMDALRSKRDMLISLGAHERATMGHDPTIRARAIEREVDENRRGR